MFIGQIRRKRIVVSAANLFLDCGFAIQGNRRIEILSENSQIIESEHVICVVVREHGGLDQVDPFANELKPQFRGGVDQENAIGCLNGNTTPCALVSGVG
tara:strand:+ start:237 stop:536 length:300 start_codon:yes stop_codon:yes gene_type:complete